MNKILAFLILLILNCSCIRINSQNNSGLEFINLDSLIITQSRILAKKGAVLTKRTQLNENQETKEFVYDSTLWMKELIKVLDLNLAFDLQAYDINKNENIISYQLKQNEQNELKSLIVQLDENGEIIYIKGNLIDDKAKIIYSNMLDIELYFKEKMLDKFLFKGYQKILFRDTVVFNIEGRVFIGDRI